MRALAFLLLFLAVLYAVWTYSRPPAAPAKEGFESQAPQQPKVNIPPPQPEVKALLGSGGPVAFTPPTTALLAPPPGQLASVNSFAYEDPSLEKAPLRRIEEVKANLKGFFAYEANALASISDPTVSLPLQTAKGDMQRLQDEVNVLARNPGIPSTLTQQDINEVEANLSYLQRKWRLSANNIPFEVEGFQDVPVTEVVAIDVKQLGAVPADISSSPLELVGQEILNTPTDIIRQELPPSNDISSLQDLRDASLRISTEIVRLQASGTTDPIVQARVENFNQLKKKLDDIIDQMTAGTLKESPLKKSYLDEILKPIDNPNLPSTLPPAMKTVLSSGGDGDKEVESMAKTLVERLLNGVSMSFNLNYMSPAEENIAKAAAGAFSQLPNITATASPYGGMGMAGAGGFPYAGADMGAPAYGSTMSGTPYRGQFDNTVQSTSTAQGEEWKPAADGSLPASTAPQGLDWKPRAEQICQQLEKRGYNPKDFGCLSPTDTVGPNFSWRGHAKMVCSRIGTIYEPGVPEMCGCPPPTWPGWRS
jgi:hypothetical protein